MAKTLGFRRSTSQGVTIDTVNNLISPLGPALAGVSTSSSAMPGRLQDIIVVYRGDPYALVVTTTNVIQIQKYDVGLNTWSVSVSYAAAVGGTQIPHCLNILNDRLVAIWTESNGASSVASAAYFNGSNWSSRVNSGANPDLNGALGGPSVVWRNAVIFATKAGIGNFFVSTGFGAFDPGFDSAIPTPLISTITQQGSFAYWNNNLYFARPDNGSGIRIMRLDPAWEAPAPIPPQWSSVTGVTGIASAGSITVSNDIGNNCLFVNKNDELCLFYSGASSTKLVKTTINTFPAFTDISSNILPSTLALKQNLGAAIYVDNRRQSNELQTLIIKDSSLGGNSITLASWDGTSVLALKQAFTGHDVLLPSGKQSENKTYTAVQPSASVIYINTSSTLTTVSTITITGLVGTIVTGDSFSITGITNATGTVLSVTGNILTLQVASGTIPTSGTFTDTTTLATASLAGTVLVSQAFPGRAVITYLVRDVLSRNVDVFGEYSLDGDTWTRMTEGSGDGGSKGVATSSAGTLHIFNWDAFADLDGSLSHVLVRMLARISVASTESAPDSFIAIIQEDYLRPPVDRTTSDRSITIGSPSKAYTPNEPVIASISGTTGLVQTSLATIPVVSTVGFAVGDTVSAVSGPNAGTGIIRQILAGPARLVIDITTVTISFPTSGTITDTISLASTTIAGPPGSNELTLTNVTGNYLFTDTLVGSISGASGLVSLLRTKLTVSSTSGIIAVGQTITGISSSAIGTIKYVSLPTIVVDVSVGTFTQEAFTTSGPGSGIITAVNAKAVTVTTVPADETVNLEEYTQGLSIAYRGRTALVFQGRLSTNQTKLKQLRFTVRGTGTSPSPKFRANVYMSGFGATNQYTGPFSSLTTLPASETEIVIDSNELSNQPAVLGKRYSIVLDFEANLGETLVCSTPFFRHE